MIYINITLICGKGNESFRTAKGENPYFSEGFPYKGEGFSYFDGGFLRLSLCAGIVPRLIFEFKFRELIYPNAKTISRNFAEKVPFPTRKTINIAYICTNIDYIYTNIDYIPTNITYIYRISGGVVRYGGLSFVLLRPK